MVHNHEGGTTCDLPAESSKIVNTPGDCGCVEWVWSGSNLRGFASSFGVGASAGDIMALHLGVKCLIIVSLSQGVSDGAGFASSRASTCRRDGGLTWSQMRDAFLDGQIA